MVRARERARYFQRAGRAALPQLRQRAESRSRWRFLQEQKQRDTIGTTDAREEKQKHVTRSARPTHVRELWHQVRLAVTIAPA